MSRIPKGVYKRASHNLNDRATPNYSILEDLTQMSCAMSALEVLQSFPMQHTALLFVIGVTNYYNMLTMKFDTTNVKPHLPYHVSFHIDIVYAKHIMRRTIVDEGYSTCVMYLSYWKDILSPEIAPSPTFLTVFGR